MNQINVLNEEYVDQEIPEDSSSEGNGEGTHLLRRKMMRRLSIYTKGTGQREGLPDLMITKRAEYEASLDASTSGIPSVDQILREKNKLEKQNKELKDILEVREHLEEKGPFTVLAQYGKDCLRIMLLLAESGASISAEQISQKFELQNELCEILANMYQEELINYKSGEIQLTNLGEHLLHKLNGDIEEMTSEQ